MVVVVVVVVVVVMMRMMMSLFSGIFQTLSWVKRTESLVHVKKAKPAQWATDVIGSGCGWPVVTQTSPVCV